MKKHWKKQIFALLFFCMLPFIGLHAKAEASIPVPTIRECASLGYRMIGILVDRPDADYYDYEIYRSSSAKGTYKRLDTLERTGTSWWSENGGPYTTYGKKKVIICQQSDRQYLFVDPTASFGKKWYYKIRLKNWDETGSFTKPVSAVSKLDTVSLRGFANASNKVKLMFSRPTGAQGYYIYRKTSGSSWKLIKKVTKASSTSYTDKKVKNGQVYSYRIRAYRTYKGKKLFSAYSQIYKVSTKKPTVKGNYRKGSVYGPSLSTSELQEVKKVVQSFYTNYITKNMTSYQKVLTAYNYLQMNCSYAWRGWQYNRANTAWGALVYGEAQCSGYARAMKALCDSMGIPCYYVHANSKSANPSHQWNEVKVNGKWYILDAQGGFFLVSGKTYQSLTGMRWNTSGLPACKSDYSPK